MPTGANFYHMEPKVKNEELRKRNSKHKLICPEEIVRSRVCGQRQSRCFCFHGRPIRQSLRGVTCQNRWGTKDM